MRQLRSSRSAALSLFTALLLLAILIPRTARAGDDVWTPLGPYGGTLRAVVFHPSQPEMLWAGTQTNGVFLSTDGGVTWTAVNQGLPSDDYRSVGFLDVSTAGRLTLYMSLYTSTLYRSIEGGRWERMSPDSGLPLGIRPLAADPNRQDVLWGSSGHDSPGIAASGDGGATWSQVYALAGGSRGSVPTGFVFAPADPSTIYAGLSSSPGAPQGVLRSRDGGLSWETAGSGLDLPEQDDVSVRLEIAADTGVLFATAEWSIGGGQLSSRVYRSADGGDHWTLVLPAGGPVTAGAGGLVVAHGGHRSLDGGLTWSPLPLPGEFLYVLEAPPASPGIVFLALSSRGLFRSTDSGASWRESNQGILAAHALDLAVDPIRPGTLYASLEGQGLFKTTEGGLIWEHLLPRAGDFSFREIDDLAAAAAGGETTLYGVEVRDRILRSEDSGATWTDLGNPGPYNIWALAVDPKAPRSVYVGGERTERCPTRKSTDGGETWKCLGLGRTFDLVVDPSRPANVWGISRIVYRSTDRGRTWKTASRGLPTDGIYTLAVAPSAQDVVYAGTWQQGVYKTTDGGRSWAPVNAGLPPHSRVVSLAVHPRNPSIVYAGVEELGAGGGGVYRSIDGGRHWKKLAASLPIGFAGPVVIDPHDPRTVYAGTRSRGFYAITLRR